MGRSERGARRRQHVVQELWRGGVVDRRERRKTRGRERKI
jgi:hypothetical protein